MKRVFALVLALALACSLGSAALAFEWDNIYRSSDSSIFGWYSAENFYAPASIFNNLHPNLKEPFTARIEWDKGGALVEKVGWKKAGETGWAMTVTIKPNYTIETAKEVRGVLTIAEKTTGKEPIIMPVEFFVANGVEEVQGAGRAADAEEYAITGVERNHIIYKCDKDSPGYVKFNSGGASLFQITARMNREEKLQLYLAEDDEDILAALDDLGLDPEAVAHTYTLEGTVPFQNPARHTLQADYADQYRIYAFDGKESLTDVKAQWNFIEGVYEWQATAMTTYVISSKELLLPAQ